LPVLFRPLRDLSWMVISYPPINRVGYYLSSLRDLGIGGSVCRRARPRATVLVTFARADCQLRLGVGASRCDKAAERLKRAHVHTAPGARPPPAAASRAYSSKLENTRATVLRTLLRRRRARSDNNAPYRIRGQRPDVSRLERNIQILLDNFAHLPFICRVSESGGLISNLSAFTALRLGRGAVEFTRPGRGRSLTICTNTGAGLAICMSRRGRSARPPPVAARFRIQTKLGSIRLNPS
jgi:hypothetical protein